MKARTVVIYQGERYESKIKELTQAEVDALKEFYDEHMGDMAYLSSFEGADSCWYWFPRRVLDECILCVEVVESDTALEPAR